MAFIEGCPHIRGRGSTVLTLQQSEQEYGHITTGHTRLGQLGVVITLLSRLNEGQECEDIIREGEEVGHCTLAWRQDSG